MASRKCCLFLIAISSTGCTHLALRNQTEGQFRTVADLQQQQVLDNLAMFIANPDSMPYYTTLGAGSSILTDLRGAQGGPTLGRTAIGPTPQRSVFWLTQFGLTLNGQRTTQESWQMQPLNDPRRLELMRCAYQKAVRENVPDPSRLANLSEVCPDCQGRWVWFYGSAEKANGADGIVTPNASPNSHGWLCWGTKKDLPKCRDCMPIGHYCGVYVWVPEEHRGELARLVLTILDFATTPKVESTPMPKTKEIEAYFDKDGAATTSAQAAYKLKATLPESRYGWEFVKEEAHQRELAATQRTVDLLKTLQAGFLEAKSTRDEKSRRTMTEKHVRGFTPLLDTPHYTFSDSFRVILPNARVDDPDDALKAVNTELNRQQLLLERLKKEPPPHVELAAPAVYAPLLRDPQQTPSAIDVQFLQRARAMGFLPLVP